jgi:sugar/nucleoside kinase (ribokinase family)
LESSSNPFLRFIVAGKLQRDFLLTPNGKAYIDVMGGSLLYAAAGLAVWESSIGLISRVGEDYRQDWLEQISKRGFDDRGIRILPETIDLRTFTAYTDLETRHHDNPISHFSRLNLPFPKSLLGYTAPVPQLDSRNQPGKQTIRMNEIPGDYLDATAAHICPLDYLSHSLLPSVFRQGQVTTLTLDPAWGYMNPVFWDDIPSLVQGLTAFLVSEAKVRSLFRDRSTDLWEMAETLASYGCEIIVIKRKGLGQYVYEHSTRSRWIVPAYPARVVDPTGAGDAFCGGFLAGYRATYHPLNAALYGNISASLVIEGSSPFYALDAMPGLAKARLEGLRDMVRKA